MAPAHSSVNNQKYTVAALSEIPKRPCDWLRDLELELPELFNECLKFSILSEELYKKKENLLPANIRDRLGVYRFKALTRCPPSPGIMLDKLIYTPPWLLRLSISALVLPIRAQNCFRQVNVAVVDDIARIGFAGLKSTRNLGQKTLSAISLAIFEAFQRGSAYCDSIALIPVDFPDIPRPENLDLLGKQEQASIIKASPPKIESDANTFSNAIKSAFTVLTEREANILEQRMGIGGRRKTLEEIAESYSLTRERIRQIEVMAVKRIVSRMSVWDTRFKNGLSNMLEGRQNPLPFCGLAVLDPWFDGVDSLLEAFEFALEHFFNPPEFEVIRIAGQLYVSRLRQDEWNEAERVSRTLLSSLAERETAIGESDVRILINSHLVGHGEELRPLLWEIVTRWARFIEGPVGERVLINYGMGAESLVETVLAESDTPLHFSEIAKRCASKGQPIDIRRAASAAANVSFLLGRGIYGLHKHIDLSEDEQLRVLVEVEEMLLEAPERQWHAQEICDELEARNLDFEGRLSNYDLNVILPSSTKLVYLGRMVWVAKTKAALGVFDRLNIFQAIVALIQKHGSPMHIFDIQKIISKDRGLGSTFQIHQSDPLIRVGENDWGILWRDIPFDENKANEIVGEIISVLKEKGSGLHTSEIIPSLRGNRDLLNSVNPYLITALAIRSEFIRSGKGGYIYLSQWEGPRRLTVSEAVEKAFDAYHDGVLAAEVARKASELLDRAVANNMATSVLIKIGIYDKEKALWFHADCDEEVIGENADDQLS